MARDRLQAAIRSWMISLWRRIASGSALDRC